MSTPSEPIIYKRPLTLSNAVELYWQPPVFTGSGPIGSYIIECANISYINVVSADDRKCIIGNLTVGTNYTFTLKAANTQGNGQISSFSFVIPGFKPDFPTNQDFTTNITDYSKINFTFNNPNYIGNSALTYNTITMLPVDISGNLSTRSSLIYNHSSKGSNIINPLVIERMNTNFNYRSYIQSVNTVNDSDKNYFSHIINPNFPTDGLKLWLDPSDLSTITFSNNKIVKWNDKSKNRSNAIVLEQFAPTYDSANNLINFNGSQYLTIPNDTIPSGNSSYSIFTYVSTSNTSRSGQWFLHSGTPASNLSLGGLINSNTLVQSWFNNNQTSNINLTADISYLVEMTYDSGIRRTFINGSLVAQDNVSSRNSSTSNNIIGSNSNLTANLVGSIGDIVIYNRILNNFERNSVKNYLERRKNDISMFNIGNLVAWLDATDSNYLYDQRIEKKASNHNYVYNWLDRSPANSSASQSNVSIIPTRRPVVQNNLGAVEFNQSSMTIPNAAYPLNAFIVLKLSNLSDIDGILSVSNSNNFSSLAYNINGGNTWSITNTANSVVSPFIETSSNMLLMEWSIGNNLNYIRRNGLNINYSTIGIWSLPNNSNIIIGNTNSFDNNRLNGNIGEIIIFSRNIGDDYRYNIEGYLAWKWGLQSQLINSHPFKLSPPYLFYKYNQTITTESLLINYLASNYSSNVWTNAGYLGVPFNAIAENGTSQATINVLGNGVSFNGSSSLSLPNLRLGNLWSVCVWARRTSSQPTGAAFVTQLYDGTSLNLAVFSNVSGKATEKQGTGGYLTNGNWFTGSNITMEMNNWYNLSYTWNGITLSSYINGNLTASVNTGVPSIDNNLSYRIGRKGDPLNTDYLRGDIGQILIYNRALSNQEISRNYFITLPNYPQPTVSFFYTGSNQTFTVPTGVTSIYIRLVGAGGKNTTVGGNGIGGKGGLVSGYLSVTPGETLIVLVGGSINIGAAPGGTFGGGGGVADITTQGFGGGRTAIMRGSNDVVTAGGGGGGGYYANGGDGGGLIGGNGTGSNSGQGGTQLTGGLAGIGGGNGSIKTGGNGGSQYAGSGGGGYYGGGGGNYSSGQNGGSGGGGSSYVGNLTGVIENIQGGGAPNDTAGNVIISW